MQPQLIIALSTLAVMVLVSIVSVYLVERFTTKQKINFQKVALDTACFYTVLFVSRAIDDVLQWNGDFVQLVCIILLGLCASGYLVVGWACPTVKVKK
ncbi:hypothetical protein [Acinetobacter variabilis]|uniref:Uncharacterized protein n=1 Tax=Acinetobacter variabilis TaxID=70346 RepID=N8VKG7_9GAMM|nr:hypothetical protein [Acinetobacter variabilis]ENV00412.1 hypothetical protein F969_00644 [Acinetobacter variabilis]